MIQKYRSNFLSLTPEEAALAAHAIVRAHPEPTTELPDTVTGEGVFNMCEVRGIDQASVVMAMASSSSPVAVSALEKLVGRPIQRVQKRAQAARTHQRAKRPRPVLRDDRIIRLLVDKNPKKAGSKTYERFELYRDGMTVQEFRQAGGTSDDVKWDAERGFIKVEDAQ